MHTVSLADARNALGDLVNRASYAGERTVIERRGKPVAVLVSLSDLETLEAIEDAADVRAHDEAKAADDGELFTMDDVRRDLEEDEDR